MTTGAQTMKATINTEDNHKGRVVSAKYANAVQQKREKDRVRKRRSRRHLTASGVKEVRELIGVATVAKMDNTRAIRGGCGGAYGRGEYLALLIEKDAKRLSNQLAKLGTCGECQKPLPEGCGGVFKGMPTCYKTQGERALRLKV